MSGESAPVIEHFDAAGYAAVREVLIDVYREVYADRLKDDWFSVERYTSRLDRHAASLRWEAVAVSDSGGLCGYAYGGALTASTGWWSKLQASTTPEFRAESGNRTFAVFEIMLRDRCRGRGLAKALHDDLLRHRTEQRVTLAVEQDHVRVRRLYESWGYSVVGVERPAPQSPMYETLVRELVMSDA